MKDIKDYYKILGIEKTSSSEDIKKAYRSLAMKYHPDRGGDERKFQEIQEAYSVLSDEQKRAEYDNPQQHQHFNSGFNDDMFDMFTRTPFGFNFRTGARNPNINVNLTVTLEDAFRGTTINAEIGLSNGKTKLVSIDIPAGVEDGMSVKYRGMGESLHPKIPPGDLIANIRIIKHHIWERIGDNLVYEKNISVWEAILGSDINLTTIDGKQINISIPPGTQPDTFLSCKGEGMPNMRTGQRGNLLIKVKINVPKNLNDEQIKTIKGLKNELSIRSS
jgi:curved DNA-binding protein